MQSHVQSTQQGPNPSQQQAADPLERGHESPGAIMVCGLVALAGIFAVVIMLSDMLAAAKAPL